MKLDRYWGYKMKSLFMFALAGLFSLNVFADDANLVATFKKINTIRKGGFGFNFLQGVNGRSPVGGAGANGCYKLGQGGSGLFQAAYRNETAQDLVSKEDFYVANLFTTNYYNLLGEYVYGDPCGNHGMDHQALLNQSVSAMPKAMTMVRHTVLERYYMETYPNSALATSRRIRGVADSADETKFARYYFNFLLSGMTQDIQFLPMSLLAKKSPLIESGVLQKARDGIANLYTARGGGDGYSGPGYLGDLYKLRNTIHNTLSKDTIAEIERFKRAYPEDAAELSVIQGYLREYYATSARKVWEIAKAAGAADVQKAAQPLMKGQVNARDLLALSVALAHVRASINDSAAFPWEKKTDALLLVTIGAQYLSKEVNVMRLIDSTDAIKVLLNAIYLEGFLIKSNYQVFANQVASADLAAASGILGKVVAVASKTIEKALSPALEQWKVVDPKMENLLDNVIKSSSLSAAAGVDAKIKR